MRPAPAGLACPDGDADGWTGPELAAAEAVTAGAEELAAGAAVVAVPPAGDEDNDEAVPAQPVSRAMASGGTRTRRERGRIMGSPTWLAAEN